MSSGVNMATVFVTRHFDGTYSARVLTPDWPAEGEDGVLKLGHAATVEGLAEDIAEALRSLAGGGGR